MYREHSQQPIASFRIFLPVEVRRFVWQKPCTVWRPSHDSESPIAIEDRDVDIGPGSQFHDRLPDVTGPSTFSWSRLAELMKFLCRQTVVQENDPSFFQNCERVINIFQDLFFQVQPVNEYQIKPFLIYSKKRIRCQTQCSPSMRIDADFMLRLNLIEVMIPGASDLQIRIPSILFDHGIQELCPGNGTCEVRIRSTRPCSMRYCGQ